MKGKQLLKMDLNIVAVNDTQTHNFGIFSYNFGKRRLWPLGAWP